MTPWDAYVLLINFPFFQLLFLLKTIIERL